MMYLAKVEVVLTDAKDALIQQTLIVVKLVEMKAIHILLLKNLKESLVR